MEEKIIFIAGGPWQKPFVKYLKNKGHYIAIVNPIETETTNIANLHIKCDINNIKFIEKFIKKIKPKFITSDQSDISTHTVSLLSTRWNLPCNSLDSIDKLTNKLSIYKFAKKNKINVPNTKLVYSTDDIKKFFINSNGPVVIKPIDSTNSRGFKKFENLSEINETIFENTKNFSKTKQVIAQNFINGSMITLDGICSNYKHKTLVGGTKNKYFKPGINQDITYPLDLENNFFQKITKVNDLYIEKSGMQFGLTHSEYIVCNNEFYLIEISGRGGGAGITDKIIPWVSGVDIYDVLYESILGKDVNVKNIIPKKNHALLKYYTQKDLNNFKKENEILILKIKGVADFHTNFKGKQFISDIEDCRHSLGIYLAKTDQELKKTIKKVESILFPNNKEQKNIV